MRSTHNTAASAKIRQAAVNCCKRSKGQAPNVPIIATNGVTRCAVRIRCAKQPSNAPCVEIHHSKQYPPIRPDNLTHGACYTRATNDPHNQPADIKCRAAVTVGGLAMTD